MGTYYTYKPQFLAANTEDIKFHKLMFIKKGGRAVSRTGEFNLSRYYYDAELICVSNENDDNWIGNFAEGFGFFGIQFAKEDCREASEEEVNEWIKSPKSIKF